MKAKKVIQEFMDLMKKMLHKSKIEKLQAYLQNLSKMSFNESEVEYLMKAVLQYIDIVINISANKGHRDQIRICNQWMDALQVVITDDVRAVFMKKVTQRIFDFLIEEDVNTWCIKKELLRLFLTCVQKSPKEVRNKTAQELPDIYLFKIVDSISTYGDYDFQVILIETVFRLFGKNTILSNLTDLIPESQELTDSFADINGDTFDEDVRKFLNILNQNSKKVFSVVCRDVFLGKIKCGEPMDNVGGLWVDFNRSENAVSWYTTAESLNGDDNLDGSNTGWILVLFFVKDVQLVQIYRPPNSNDAIIYVKLKQPCMVSFESSVDCAKAEDVKFVISSDSNRVKALISEVLPAMFKNKLHNHSLKVSLGKKAVYKPLKVSFRRRTRSDSKSDTSSFSALVNAVSGLNNKSCDGSEVHSMSSLSTKCDVISISDGSVHSNESSIDLVPSLRQPSQNVEVERSQYETSEMCTSHHSQEACKISMNRFVSKEHNSNNLSITDGTHNIPGVIRKISGRYSGWKSSLATFTPKKKSCPRLQIEKSSTASCNIVEGNSSDRYETAQGDPQSLFDRQGMTSEAVLDGKELAQNERDKLLLLEDVLENDATIPKNKGAELELKRHDEKFSVSKSLPKSKEQQSKEISLQRNKIESMSQRKEQDQKGNVKDVTRRQGDNKNLISFNTKDLFPKGILSDIGEYVATPLEEHEKPNKDIVIDLESDVESLDVSSQEVLLAINKKIAEESQSNISVIKKGNVEPSPMANEIKETKNNLSFTDGTHNIPGKKKIVSGRYSGSKSSLATFTPKKKLCPRLQIEKSSTASGNIVEGNSSDRYETAQGDPQSLFYRQGMTSEDVLDGEELAANERDKLLLLEDVLENEATIPKNKGADLEPKWHDEKFSVSKSSLKSKEQQSKEISLQRNKIESMSQGMEKDQKGNVKDVTRRGDNKNLISFNTKDLFPKGNLIDIGEYVATPLEENEKPNKDIVIDLESDVESLDVSSQEVLPAINKKIAEESQSNISVIKKGNVEPSPMANEIKETKNNLSFTDGTHNIPGRIKIISGRYSGSNSSLATSTPKKKSCPRLQIEKSSTASGNIVEGNSSDRYETAQGVPQNLFNRQATTCDNIPGRIKIISGRYSRSKSFPATSISKKISFPIRQVENNNASGNIVGDNSFNRYKTAQGVPQNLFHRQGTTCEDVVNGEKLTQNKRDKLLLLKDVLENDATISKNKETNLKPKQQDEKFLVSKSSLKSEEQKSEERPVGRKVFKEISLESNKIELMSRCKEKDQTRNVKDKTREEDNIENLVLFNTEDLFPKVILTDIEKYAATIMEVNKKPDKDIVIDLESDVENLEVPSLEVLPTVNKTIANQSHLNVSFNKKGNAKEPSSTANENNEKKEGNPVLFNTEDLLPKVILTDIEKYAVTKMEVNKKPDKDIVIDLKSDVENLDVPSQEVLPTVNKTIASQSQSNVFINKKGNAEEPSPMANENNENKEVDALTSSVNRFMPRGRNSDDLPSTDGTHNVLGEIRIISGRYSGSKNSPATSKPKKKKSSPRLQVEKSSTASGDIIKGNSTDCCRQGTTHEDVLNGEELVQNKLDELPSLEDVSENDAIISKNKGADLEPKQQDEKFSVSKSMPKSEKRKRKERLARRKIFKQISPERNKIKLMSQSKNKEQTRNVKDKTRQESLVLINTEDLLPKVILTNIGKYTQKPNKDIVIDLESDVENLNVPSQAVLPTVNKTNARELQSNVSAIKKGNTEGLSPTANEENEKKDDNLSSSDSTHNVSGEIRIISGKYSSSKSSLATSVPNKKLSTRLQVEKSNSATGDIVEGNSCDHYETTQGITQNPSDLQQTTCEDFLNGEELAQNKRDKLLLLEGVLDKEATILKKKGANLELKRHDEEFSVSNSSLKSKEQKREGKSAGRKIFKQISPERNKIKLMSQCKDKEQTRNVKDMTRQENDKENLVLFNTEDLFPKVILTNIGKYVEKPNKGIVPSQEVLPAVNEAIVSESQSNVSVIKKENAEKASPMVNEDNEKKEEEIGLNKEADARPALTLIPDQRENLEYARQLSASTVENNAGENNNDEFIQDRERDFNELRKHHNQTYLSTTLGGTKRRKLYDPNDLTYLENIELFKEKDKETHTVEPSAKPQEKSIRRKVFRKKEVHHKQHKSKKLKVVRPHTTLNVSKHCDNSKLKLTFCEVLDSFRKESKSSFLNILKSTAAGKSVKEKKKVVKASKNNSTKVAKKLRTKPKNILIRNECARDHSVSDNSSASLKLVGEHKCTDDETDLDSLCREKVPYIEPDKKINIISDIQLRPKRTLLQNKSEVQNKKMKNENNPASDIEDDFCIMSKHISNNEICNWIETGSPNYNADISERRTVLKYVYFMSKKALGNPDASQEYQDLLNVCRLLKKYV